MIVRAFMITIASASMLSTVSQAMHSDEEKSSTFRDENHWPSM